MRQTRQPRPELVEAPGRKMGRVTNTHSNRAMGPSQLAAGTKASSLDGHSFDHLVGAFRADRLMLVHISHIGGVRPSLP